MWRASLAVAILMAGCTAPLAQPTLPLAPPPPSATLVGLTGSLEAGLSTSADGQVQLVCSHGGFARTSPVWASTDGGATWVAQELHAQFRNTGDCDVEVLDDGTWLVVLDSDYGPRAGLPFGVDESGAAQLFRSTDQGRTWSETLPQAIGVGVPLVGDRPYLGAQGGEVQLVYGNYMAQDPAIMTAARSHDHGATWDPPSLVTLPTGPDTTHVWRGDVLVDGATTYAPLQFTDGSALSLTDITRSTFTYARSQDGGRTWTLGPTLAQGQGLGSLPVMATAPDGTLYYAEASRDGNGTKDGLQGSLAHLFASHDGGLTWAPAASWSTGLLDNGFPNLSMGMGNGTGTLWFAWQHEGAGQPASWNVTAAAWDGTRLHFHDVLPWTAQDNSIDAGPTVDVDAHGQPHVAYTLQGGKCMDGPQATACVYAWNGPVEG